MRDFVGALIAQVLRNGLLKILVRSLAFDDAERDAIDEQNNVRPARLGRAGTLNVELLADMEDVVGENGPVDVFQRTAARVALDRLIERGAKLQEIGRQFVQPHDAERLAAAQTLSYGLEARFENGYCFPRYSMALRRMSWARRMSSSRTFESLPRRSLWSTSALDNITHLGAMVCTRWRAGISERCFSPFP